MEKRVTEWPNFAEHVRCENLCKQQRVSEERRPAPLFVAMLTRPTYLPLALPGLSLPGGHVNWVPSYLGSCDTMLSGLAYQMKESNNVKWVSENPQQTLSETMATRPVPHVVLDKGKQLVEYPSPLLRLLFRSSNPQPSKPANDSWQLVGPAPAPVPASAVAAAAAAMEEQNSLSSNQNRRSRLLLNFYGKF